MREAFAVILSVLAVAGWPAGAGDIQCPSSGPPPKSSVLVGYTRPADSTFWAFALLVEGDLLSEDGRHLAPGKIVHSLLGPSQATIQRVDSYLDLHGDDHCVYPAVLSSTSSNSWEVWASRADLREQVRRPSPEEIKRFRTYEPTCVVQGDETEGTQPNCVYPELIAVSDLDHDESLEYWHSVPYRWDTGFRIAEQGQAAELVELLSACPGCSD